MKIKLELLWHGQYEPNRYTEVTLGLWSPASTALVRIGKTSRWTVLPSFERTGKSLPYEVSPLTVTFTPNDSFCVNCPQSQFMQHLGSEPVHVYDVEGGCSEHTGGGVVSARTPQTGRISLKIHTESPEDVLFVIHVWTKVHVNCEISMKWQSCGRVCVLGKYLKDDHPICLPLGLRSADFVTGKQGVVVGHVVLTPSESLNFKKTTDRPLHDVLMHELIPFIQKQDDFLSSCKNQFPKTVQEYVLSPASIFADGLLHPLYPSLPLMQVYYGSSPQSYWLYRGPCATADFFLERLRDCLSLHGTSEKEFIRLVQEMKAGHEETSHHLRCRADIVRVYTTYFTTRPYAPDKSFFFDGDFIRSIIGDFYEPFHMGDCEDGGIGIHQLWLTMLLHEWGKQTALFTALRQGTALLGAPIGIVGKSQSPITGKKGEGHMFGCILPWERFVFALGNNPAYRTRFTTWFAKQYGFSYPFKKARRAIALESTVFSTPHYTDHQDSDPTVHDMYHAMVSWMEGHGYNKCGWSNMTYTHLLGAQGRDDHGRAFVRTVHEWSVRFFASIHFAFLPEMTCASFIPLCRTAGVHYDDLFESDNPLELQPTFPVTREQFELDRRIFTQFQKPFQVLDANTPDEFNDEQDAEAYAKLFHDAPIDDSEHHWHSFRERRKPHHDPNDPHVTVFVYAFKKDTLKELMELFQAVDAAWIYVTKYTWCTAFVFIKHS